MSKFIFGLVALLAVSTTASSAIAEGWRPAHDIVRVQHNGVFYNRPVGWGWGGGWRWASTVEGDWMVGLGQLRLATAQAMLVRAQAAYEWEKVRQLRALVNFQINELKVLQRTKWNLLQQSKKYENQLSALTGIVNGRLQPWTFSAINFFLAQPNVDVVALSEITVGAMRADSGLYRTNEGGPDRPFVEFAGGNLVEFAEFLRTNSYSTKVGSQSWVQLNKLRTYFIEKGEEILDEVVDRYNTVKDGQYDPWEPLSIHSTLVDFEGKDPKAEIK